VPRGIQLTSTNRSRAYPKFLDSHSHPVFREYTLPVFYMRSWRNGRRARLRGVWGFPVEVRVFSTAPCFWGISSVGRAPALQAGGQRFESAYLHHYSSIAQLVERPTVNRTVTGSSPVRGASTARWRSGLTHRPFKAAFTGSNPVRVTKRMIERSSIPGGLAQLGERLPYKQRVGGSIPSASTIFIWSCGVVA
jgi:hypothetical protein